MPAASAPTHLAWFRADLRVADNPALHAACADPEARVLGVFFLTPEQWRSFDWGQNRVRWLLANLRCLAEELAALGIPLLVREAPGFDAVPVQLAELAAAEGVTRVYACKEYELDERQRDGVATEVLAEAGVELQLELGVTLLEPDLPRTKEGGFYTVFSPYKRRFLEVLEEQGDTRPLPAPAARGDALSALAEPIPEMLPGFAGALAESLPEAGEAAARARLQDFVEAGLAGYQDKRDRPDLDGTSRLSPHLAVGSISPRQCWAASEGHQGSGPDTWRSELIWREFYKHVVLGYPRVCMHRAFRPETETLPWSDDAEVFAAWCEGRTGIPIVDAAMRQLRSTGWMHNRLRMIVAMFLSKNLFLDWGMGERFFNEHLIDADFASNNGGWQWSASTGTDAAPYFRIFNPLRQSERFDPDGDFLRHWLPELQDLQGADLHDPGRIPPLMRAELDYPQPMVDLKQTRQAAIERFQAAR